MNINLKNDVLKMHSTWEFQGGLVVRIQSFHCSALGLIPGWRTEILQAVHMTKTNQKTNQENSVCGSHYYAILMFSFFFFKYLLIYLAVPALSCGMWDLVP